MESCCVLLGFLRVLNILFSGFKSFVVANGFADERRLIWWCQRCFNPMRGPLVQDSWFWMGTSLVLHFLHDKDVFHYLSTVS